MSDITRKILGENAEPDDLKSHSQHVRNYLVDRKRLQIRAETDNVRWVYLSPEILVELGFETLIPRPIKPVIPVEPVIPTLDQVAQTLSSTPSPTLPERLESESTGLKIPSRAEKKVDEKEAEK